MERRKQDSEFAQRKTGREGIEDFPQRDGFVYEFCYRASEKIEQRQLGMGSGKNLFLMGKVSAEYRGRIHVELEDQRNA